MTAQYIRNLLITLSLILLQVTVFNRFHLFGVATPYLFVYLLIKFPAGMSRSLTLLASFLIGFVLDIFTNTPGLNAGTLTIAAMLRPVVINLFLPKDIQDSYTPSAKTAGTAPFWRYTIAIVAVHHILLVFAELFSFVDFVFMLLRILFSILFTLFFLLLIETLNGELLKSKPKPIR